MNGDRDWRLEAGAMVERLPEASPRARDVMRRVPRHRFVAPVYRHEAYEDEPLPAGHGESTISAPHMVALQLDWLDPQPGQRVLEVGSGTGYLLALLAELVGPTGRVDGIEIERALVAHARTRLAELGYASFVHLDAGDASEELPPGAYHRVLVSCASPSILSSWKASLLPEGFLVAPIGDAYEQRLLRFRRTVPETIERGPLCRFVPLRSPRKRR